MLLENDISRPAILEHLPSPTQNPRLMTLDVQLEQVYRFRSWQQLIELGGYYLKKLSPIPGAATLKLRSSTIALKLPWLYEYRFARGVRERCLRTFELNSGQQPSPPCDVLG